MLMSYHTNTDLQNCAFCHILLACIASQRQHQKSRSTGHGNAWTRPDSTGADEAPAPEADTDEETETAPAAEPPRNQSQKRNDRRARASTTAAETRPPADSQRQKSRRDRARAREPEARHCRPRETDGDRKTKREEKKRGNEEKTTVKRRFSPRLTERPADQPPEPAQHRSGQQQKRRFFGSAFVEYAELTEINASFDHTKDGGRFTFSRLQQRQKFGFVPSSPRLYLFHQTPSLKHTVHQRHIPLQT
jgi:hypothetical protein